MTIYFAGGELGAFIPSDSSSKERTETAFRNTSFSRAALYAAAAGYNESATFTALTEIWAHVELAQESYITGTVNSFTLRTGAGVDAIKLVYDRGADTLALQYWNGASYTTVGSIGIAIEDSHHDIDVHAIVNSASGSVVLYVSGTERINSGAINLSGTASITTVRSYGAANAPVFSQVIVANEPTIGWRLMTYYPSGAGSDSSWTGTYASIDETVTSDADFISSSVADQVSMFAGTYQSTVTGYVPRAVVVTARAKKGASGPSQLQLALRVSGTNYFSSSKSLAVSYGAIVNVWETSPATTVDWTSAELTGLQFGVKSIT